MTKPEIIGSIRSTYTRAVCMVCEEKSIDYVLTETPLRAPELFAIHPLGKMPAMRHNDFVLFESKAIATYLDRVFDGPQLTPSDPRAAALTEQWVSFVNTIVDRTAIRTYLFAYIVAKLADKAPDRATIDKVLPELDQQLSILDKAVASTGHLVGDRVTLADLNLMPILHRLGQAPEGADMLARLLHLSAYYKRHAERPSFQRTDPPPGPPGQAKSS
jgi:glutathione S-transferase